MVSNSRTSRLPPPVAPASQQLENLDSRVDGMDRLGRSPMIPPLGPKPSGTLPHILLVDDEEFLCDMGSQLLTRAGYTVLTATNGREALDLYGKERSDISLVILDLIMPEMGGKECFQELVNINPQVRVILSSGFLSNGTTEEARIFGVRGLVEKPYNMRQLLGLVRDVLDED